MRELLDEIRNCTICKQFLPHPPRPIVSASRKSKILIIGQAPGRIVHESGIPWDDRSGDLLRDWLNFDKDIFYDPEIVALIPMGFCYPGKGKSGDLPPRPECAEAWHNKVLEELINVEITILVGQYAQKHYLKDRAKINLTETVRSFSEFAPDCFPVPHPSPRNRNWFKKNEWFDQLLIPSLRKRIQEVLKN